MNLRFAIPLLLALLGAVGCGAPSAVEGEVEGRAWSLRNLEPELKQHRGTGDAQIVFADADGERLRTVVLFVEGRTEITADEPIVFGEGVNLLVSEGDLVELDNGVINAEDPTFHGVVKGEIVFTSLSNPIEGEFWAELENGGFIEGTFILEGSLR